MIRILDTTVDDVFGVLTGREVERDGATEKIVSSIIADVRSRGDEALLESARRFDAPDLASICVSSAEIEAAVVSERAEAAITRSIERVRDFHRKQRDTILGCTSAKGGAQTWSTGTGNGFIGQRFMPVASAGVYVPGGRAAYPSSVIMNAVPAQEAKVQRVAVTTPSRRDGTLDSAVLVALRLVGVTEAFKVGGAAAIAALALGTESVSRVAKIVGPGNRFVNEAKKQLWGTVGLDGYAGPSEVCVLADASTNARFAAADLLTQIEHAPDNAGFLVCTDRSKLDEILAEVDRQATGTANEATMRAALRSESLAIVVRDLVEACAIVDAIAPEHLSIACCDPESTMEQIHNAGCILLGEWSSESAGDFAAGPSHTLPTRGSARFGSPVNVLDFLRVQSVIQLTRDDLADLSPVIEAFGEIEGFPTHARGATIRFE